jgi:hypothetical protein
VDGVPAETVAGLYREIVARTPGTIRVWPARTSFIDVGTPADYLQAAARFGGTNPSGSVVWPGGIVPATARLTDCIVAGPVRVPAGFIAARAVIVPASIAVAGDRATIVDDMAVFGF